MAAGTSNGRWVSPPERNPAAKAEDFQQKTRCVLHQQFSAVDILFVLISLITYILDFVTDCMLAWQYFRDGHSVCGIWTLVFICVPTLTLQLLSLRWYHSQGRQLCCSWTLVAHLFLCGPVERYVSVLRYGHEARRSQQPVAYERLYQAHNDVTILRFVEAFMESAPQLILQGYFSLTTQSITWVTGVSLALSLVSLAWSVAAYSNALRLAYRERYLTHWPGLVVQTLSHSCTVASRVLAIVIFATVFHQWTFLPIGLHWAAMSLWVLVQSPDFFPHRWENRLFSLVLGVVHIFCFLNLKDGRSRWRMWPFYTLILAENGLLTGLWYREHATFDPLMIVVTSVVFGGFLLGVLWLLAYYRLCHPSGHIYLWGEDKAAPCEEPTQMEPQRRKIFDASLVSRSPFSHEGYNLSLDSSWSGLVHSRRGETPFTASRYDTSSTGLYLEDNKTCTARKPDDVCNKVFDTPLCGGVLPNKKTEALETGIKGAPLAVSESCGMSSQLSDSCHISLSSIRSVLSSDMHESVGSGYGSGLGCVSLDLSANTRSVSQISRQVGYDNAAFSVGSLRSGKSLQEAGAKVQGPTNRLSSTPATFTVSLPSLVHLSSSQIGRRNNSDENQSHHSSVFAITGTPNSSSNLSMHKSGETSTYHPKSIQDRMRMLRGARQFDHTQSMQCITSRRHHFDTRTLPMKQKKSRSKMRSSCESLSSLSSYHKPRPLSPLNVNTLWEESVIRINKSCELESSVSVMKSVNEETCDEDAESFSAPQKEESLGSLSDDQNSSLQKSTESPGVNKSLSSRSLNRSDSRSHISEESVSKSNLISPNSSGNLKNSEMSSVGSGIGDPTKDRPDFSGHSEDSNNRWFCLSSRRNGDDSSGFESSGLDQSGSFFDYSDSVPNQSKHTLSDLAGRLAVALDLNSSADKQVEHPSLGSSTAGFNLAQSSHLNPAYSDTPWRVDYLRRIPTPILQQSHLSCYSASDRSLSLASDMEYMERSRLGSSAYFGLPDHVSAEISKATSTYLNGHQNPACFGNRTPLKIYNLTKSPRAGKPGRTQGRFHEKLHLEDYADSPYKHTQKRRQCHNKSTSPSLKLLGRSERSGFDSHDRENLPRKVSSQLPHQISCQVKIERQNASSLSSSYSRGKHASICASSDSSKQSSGFSNSSESSCWDDVSYSDTAENISPMLQSWHKRTPKSANRQTSSATPDCSPIELPPLTTGTGVLKPRQSYFSTPKVHIPGLESPSLHAENLTDDSFFGVEVPRLRLINHNSKDAKLRTRPPLFSPKSPTERPNSGVGSRTDEDVKKSVRSSSTDDFTLRNKKQPKHKIPEYKPQSFRI